MWQFVFFQNYWFLNDCFSRYWFSRHILLFFSLELPKNPFCMSWDLTKVVQTVFFNQWIFTLHYTLFHIPSLCPSKEPILPVLQSNPAPLTVPDNMVFSNFLWKSYFLVFELQLTYDDPSVRARRLIHERPPWVPRTRVLPFSPLELEFRPKHLPLLVRRVGHPQVDPPQKRTLLASPAVLLVVRCEPELSDGFLTSTVEIQLSRILILICHDVALCFNFELWLCPDESSISFPQN